MIIWRGNDQEGGDRAHFLEWKANENDESCFQISFAPLSAIPVLRQCNTTHPLHLLIRRKWMKISMHSLLN